jgi:hypothetical protein
VLILLLLVTLLKIQKNMSKLGKFLFYLKTIKNMLNIYFFLLSLLFIIIIIYYFSCHYYYIIIITIIKMK